MLTIYSITHAIEFSHNTQNWRTWLNCQLFVAGLVLEFPKRVVLGNPETATVGVSLWCDPCLLNTLWISPEISECSITICFTFYSYNGNTKFKARVIMYSKRKWPFQKQIKLNFFMRVSLDALNVKCMGNVFITSILHGISMVDYMWSDKLDSDSKNHNFC